MAVERVTGKLGGRSGSFALAHKGTMAGGKQHMDITIVPDSGTDELAGLSGKMTIIITPTENTRTSSNTGFLDSAMVPGCYK